MMNRFIKVAFVGLNLLRPYAEEQRLLSRERWLTSTRNPVGHTVQLDPAVTVWMVDGDDSVGVWMILWMIYILTSSFT